MAGKIKSLSRSDGVTTDAPTSLAYSGNLDAATVGGADNDGTDGYLLLKDQSADPTATSGDDVKIFAKDKGVYKVDSTGVASEIGSGTGSGELNYIANPSAAVDVTGWVESTDTEVDVSRTTTASELPRENLTATGIKIVGTGTTAEEYVAYDFNLDDADLSKTLKLQWAQKPLGSYAAGELEVVIYDLDNSAEIIPAITEIPAYTGIFQTTWVSDSASLNYELRIKNPNASATDGIVISDVVVGPGSYAVIPDPRWPSYSESEVTLTEANWTTANSEFIPYQTSNNSWRLRFNLLGSYSSATDDSSIAISGIVVPYTQAIAATQLNSNTDVLNRAYIDSSGILNVEVGNPQTDYTLSGDVALASKPTWATKTAPDVYLAGKVNVDEVACNGYMSSSPSAYSDGDTIVFDTIETDTHSAYSAGSYTIPVSGLYAISVKTYDSSVATDKYNGTTFKIGSTIRSSKWDRNMYASNNGQFHSHYHELQLDADDVLTINVLTNDTNITVVGDSTNRYSSFSITKIPSPQEVANAALTFSTATADRPGLVQKNKWEKHTYTSAASDLDFDNLISGKLYRITVLGELSNLSNAASEYVAIVCSHDSSEITRVQFQTETYNTSDTRKMIASTSAIFEASAATLSFSLSSAGSVAVGTRTYAILEELNNYESETTDFTP